ncbi:V4R domain-containing protein [Rummeliibacillus sp. JY-2-4R]
MKSTNMASEIVITSQSFGLLRKTLIENMGVDRAKKILFQFGKELGGSRETSLQKENFTMDDLIKEHINLGHISAITYDNKINYIDEKRNLNLQSGFGIWHDSFEVEIHLNFLGKASECSCYTLSGFASGILSHAFREEILVKEITCRSKGDQHCSFQVKTKKEWMNEGVEFNNQTILNELEDTYDKLLEKHNLLNKVTKYHGELTESVINQNNIQQIIHSAYSILNVPVFISNQLGKLTVYAGLNETALKHVRSHPLNVKKCTKTTRLKIDNYHILTSPIYIENQLFATCSFLYCTNEIDSNDYLFLERLVSVSTLYFLNDKVKFETAERLKISFLDRLINKQFKNNTELVNQAQFINPHITNDFITLAIKYKSKKATDISVDIYNIVLQISRLLQLYNIHGLVTQRVEHIIVFIYSINDYSIFKRKIDNILKELCTRYNHFNFSVGISNKFNRLEDFDESIIQAEQAMNVPRGDILLSFSDLGLLGAILQKMNSDDIINLAQKELGELLTNTKSKELLYTLFIYLRNSGKLEKTMKDLSLSLGGLQYRLRKIEAIIGKDLKDSATTSYLFLLLECLNIIGEINFT